LNSYEYAFPILDGSERLAVLQHAHQDYCSSSMELGAVGLLLFHLAVGHDRRRLQATACAHSRRRQLDIDDGHRGHRRTMVNALFCFPYQLAVPQLAAGLYLGKLCATGHETSRDS